MRLRRLMPAFTAAGLIVTVLAAAAVPATSAATAAPGTAGWARLPAAARGPVLAALTRDREAADATTARQSSLTARPVTAGAELGETIAVSGNTIAVGAPLSTVGKHVDQGAVYVFTRPASGWRNVTQTAELTAADGGSNDLLGNNSLAMNASTIVVGAVNHQVGSHAGQGAVYVFTKPAKGWATTSRPAAELTVSNGASGDGFGQSVAISGGTIVAGSYKRAGTHGGSPTVFQGEAYVYSRPRTGWKSTTETAGLTAKSGDELDQFGYAVAVSGNVIVVGARGASGNTGAVYVFVKPATSWVTSTETRQLAAGGSMNEFFGESVAVAGTTVVVGASEQKVGQFTNAGAVDVFLMPAGGWGDAVLPAVPTAAVLTADDAATGDELGSHVAISGTVIAASAPERKVGTNVEQGAVYRFARPASGWKTATQSGEVEAAGGSAGDQFGISLALDGATTAVGAPDRNASNGAAYAFAPPGPTLSAVKQSHRTWHLGRGSAVVNPAHKRKSGDDISFRLSQPATVALAFTERIGRHTVHKGTLKVKGRSGVNHVFIEGSTSHGKTLVPGRCTVTISATSVSGSTAHRRLTFVARKRRHH